MFCQFNGVRVVGTATNSSEALRKISGLNCNDITILTDYHLRERINGMELANQISTIKRRSKVLIMSADESVKSSVLNQGAQAFIPKPIDFNYLMNCL